MVEFLQDPKVSLFLSLFGIVLGLIGAISAYFTIKSYFDQKKFSSTYNDIFEKAQNDWKGKYTEEEVNKLSDQFKNLTKQVTIDVPLMAKKVLLEMKLDMIIKEILDLTEEYKILKKEHGDITSSLIIDQSIMKYIEDEIEPRSNSKRSIKNMILIISIAFVLFFMNPFTNRVIEYFIYFTIDKSRAHLHIYDISIYISALIIVMGIVYNFNTIKLFRLSRTSRIKKVILSILLLSLWAMIIVILSYDLIYRSYMVQLILGVISLVFFAVGTRLFVYIFKR